MAEDLVDGDALDQLAKQEENGVGRYWRITAPGGATSYLWGTFHSAHPLILNLPDRVLADLKKTRVVATEVDSRLPSRAAVLRAFSAEDWFRKETSPPWQFTPETTGISQVVIDQIRARTHAIGWQSSAPDYLTLGALTTLLLSDPCEDFTAGSFPIQDSRIQMLGMIQGATPLGLEPPDAFLEHLDNPKNRAAALAILQVYGALMRPIEGARAGYFALYREGKISHMQALERLLLREVLGPDADPHLQRTDAYLLEKRNLDFLAAALADLKQGGVFMAIGAYHLPGDTGMVALLRDAGFDMTRVPLPGEALNP